MGEHDETKPGNEALRKARVARKDEFYTQFEDINNELQHYGKHFAGKTVLCNCDDPYESNFFKYFALKFNELGIKKLIATCYSGSPVAQQELALFCSEDGAVNHKTAYRVEITEVGDVTGDGVVDLSDVEELLKNGKNVLSILKGNGDFRSEECLELLKEADIVVTNPPFSLFRDYMETLVKYEKKFLIIGNMNAITYKEIFPLIKENKMWLGYGFSKGNSYFRIPPENIQDYAPGVYDASTGLVHFRNVTWFTNLDHSKRHEPMQLMSMADNLRYSRHKDLQEKGTYQKYDNYDAIEVPYTDAIPCDYPGVMGVPISFLDKYCPEQFEILGLDRYTVPKEFLVGGRVAIDGQPRYARILIRAKERRD